MEEGGGRHEGRAAERTKQETIVLTRWLRKQERVTEIPLGAMMRYSEIENETRTQGRGPQQRIDIEPERVEQGLVKLVLVVVELIRKLLEKQAIRRIDRGRLSKEQVEQLSLTLMRLEAQMRQLQTHFKIDDLDLDLGPIGKVIDP